MSLYEKIHQSMEARNVDAWHEVLHDDFEFVRHQSGTSMNKAEMIAMLDGFMRSDAVVEHSRRCIYENDDVLVFHSVVDFPDNTREAIMSVYTKKDGQLVRGETGATLLKH